MPMLEKWENFIYQIREFFKLGGYTEVMTPVLRRYPNLDSNVEPIEVDITIRGNKEKYWLHTSPEYSMKKLLAKYGRDIFQITKVFRNNEIGSLHYIEFTMLEWYKKDADYKDLIEEIKDLLELFGYKEFEEISVEEAFEKYADVILSEDEDIFKNNLITAGYEFDDNESWETIFYRIYSDVERYLGKEKPTFLVRFPSRLCALAKIRDGYAERFELYINGIEIANGWTEETSMEEIKLRLLKESERKNLPVDEEFIKAHKNMPECAGCSVGLERLFMVLEGLRNIHEIYLIKI